MVGLDLTLFNLPATELSQGQKLKDSSQGDRAEAFRGG